MIAEKVRSLIRDVPDFPKPGIVFKDITPVLSHGPTLAALIDHFAEEATALEVDVIAGPESRGFLFGTPLAAKLGKGFVPVRKPGKLPWKTRHREYELEYGTDRLEMHEDAVAAGQRVLLIDDLLATGGTMEACCQLVEDLGGQVVACSFLIELGFLNGRDRLAGREIRSVVTY